MAQAGATAITGSKRGRLAEGGPASLTEGHLAALPPSLAQWMLVEEQAESLVPLIGSLYRQNVVVSLCDRTLANRPVDYLVGLHRFAASHFDEGISVADSVLLCRALQTLSLAGKLGTIRFDVGFGHSTFTTILKDTSIATEAERLARLTTAIESELAKLPEMQQLPAPGAASPSPTASSPRMQQARDVVLFGFGRIGRLLARILVAKTGAGVKMLLRAIVLRPPRGRSIEVDLRKRAQLLRADSVHGKFAGYVEVDTESSTIFANGVPIKVIYAPQPESIDYTAHGITDAILLDNTGAFRDRKGLSRHLEAKGISKVVLTAPAKGGDVTTVVAGVNDDRVADDVSIYSSASCTTNAIVPVLTLVHEELGIESGHVETVHSFTNDQNLIDNIHNKDRRGRSAVLNMTLTETGAAKAVARAIPELAGKLSGSAIRVPTPDVSVAVLTLHLKKPTTKEAFNELVRRHSISGKLHRQVEFSSNVDAASTDFVGADHTSIVDGPHTIVSDGGKTLHAYVHYDNEWGFSQQVIRLTQRIAGVVFPQFPPERNLGKVTSHMQRGAAPAAAAAAGGQA